jgi:hypothetical protein
VSGADHLRGAETFQATHGSEPGFESAVVAFNRIVLILLIDVMGDGDLFVEDAWAVRA